LASSGLAVYAVELPGHDVGLDGEPFEPLEQVVEQVVTEIAQRALGPVLLWGHSSGAAFAVETARRLQENGVEVRRVFVAAHLLGDAADRRADIVELESYGNPEIATALIAGGGYTEIPELDEVHAEHIGAAYRHDCVSAHRYFLDVLDAPPKLTAPVTVVLATDDPYTAKFAHRHRDWQLLAPQVDAYEVPDGGHYFVRTRPTEAAWAVLSSEQLSGAPQ
jgi:surfactin synthase thioesterase subunit